MVVPSAIKLQNHYPPPHTIHVVKIDFDRCWSFGNKTNEKVSISNRIKIFLLLFSNLEMLKMVRTTPFKFLSK